MTLRSILTKIANGKALNFAQVVKALPSSYAWSDIFIPELVSKNRYLVSIKNQTLFDELLLLSEAPEGRVNAAAHPLYDSHSVSCDSVYKLVFPAFKRGKESVLEAIAILDDKLLAMPFEPSESLILIENQDCFFRYQRLLPLFAEQLPNTPTDVVFSAGKQILDYRLLPFLNQYKAVFCLFDYDYFGLLIFKHLQLRLQGSANYLLPDKLFKIAELFSFKPNNTAEFLKAVELANELECAELAKQFITSKHFMEQEALLTLVTDSSH